MPKIAAMSPSTCVVVVDLIQNPDEDGFGNDWVCARCRALSRARVDFSNTNHTGVVGQVQGEVRHATLFKRS